MRRATLNQRGAGVAEPGSFAWVVDVLAQSDEPPAPVRFERPDQPVGTHVYTAMGLKADGKGLRWTVVSIPSGTKHVAELRDQGRKSRTDHAPKVVETETLPSASVALDRIVMPPELVERISELMTPGSSLIVSDNKLSDETGEYTDFIVLTR